MISNLIYFIQTPMFTCFRILIMKHKQIGNKGRTRKRGEKRKFVNFISIVHLLVQREYYCTQVNKKYFLTTLWLNSIFSKILFRIIHV